MEYYTLTLNPRYATSFPGYQCSNYDLFRRGYCSLNPINIMGFYSRADIPGKFYVEVSYVPLTHDEKVNFLYFINRIMTQIKNFL